MFEKDDATVSTPLGSRNSLVDIPKTTVTKLMNNSTKAPEKDKLPTSEKVVEKGFEEDNWDSDPDNPRNWVTYKKWTAVGIVSFYTLFPPLASSMMAPGLPEVAQKYNITNPTILALTLSVFLISFSIGPLFFAPLSELYGRTLTLHVANLFTLGFSLGCAFAPSTGVFILFRLLSGFSGSAPFGIGGGSVSDVFAERDRAAGMALYSLGPLLGPALGPVAGGFIAQRLGIRWVFIVIALLCGVASLVGIPLLKETYAPIVRMRKAKKAGDLELATRLHPAHTSEGRQIGMIWTNVQRPIILLTHSFICFILSLYMAFIFGTLFLLFSTFPTIFSDDYGFQSGVGGLAYLGLGVGFVCATAFGAKVAALVYSRLSAKNGGIGKPEFRIPALIFGSFFIPVGLLWFGWSAKPNIHWIMPIIGSGIFGFGMMTCFLPIQLYLADSFNYAASAIATAATFRSLLGFAFPLFGSQMFEKLTVGGGCSLMAGLAIILGIPFPIWIYYNGEAMRARSTLTRK
ncbi:multidrug resistance protein 4 [Crepidotus variabilis]|uniref:Multidrug resistance protein 4 n=1 Tax=Crepidotus variabilis TaxID=179855 RepID=A0A9P6JLD0_9AGAR|nr:multidrug resistance protein 4 [Crepidotus variabilis]